MRRSIKLQLPADAAQLLDSQRPKSLSLSQFCATLLESMAKGLDMGPSLPAYRVGAGNYLGDSNGVITPQDPGQDITSTVQALPSSENDAPTAGWGQKDFGERCRDGGSGETPRSGGPEPEQLPADPDSLSTSPRPRTRKSYSPEFQIFWAQYQAISNRTSSQAKPLAFKHWQQATKTIPPDRLRFALQRAVEAQDRTERQGGFAAPFPDCFRWLRDGRYEAALDALAPPPPPPAFAPDGRPAVQPLIHEDF